MKPRLKSKGRPVRNNAIYAKINLLNKGESLVVKNKEWEQKATISRYLLRRRLAREFKVETLADESGFLVTAL